MPGADHRLLSSSVAEQTAALLAVVDQHERDLERSAERLVLEVDGQWTAELSGHTEAVRVRLGSRARSVLVRDEQGALRAFLMIDELDVSGESGANSRRFDRGRIGLVLRRRPGGLELEVRTQPRSSEPAEGRGAGESFALGTSSSGSDRSHEPPALSALHSRTAPGEPKVASPMSHAGNAPASEPPVLHSPPMLEDELGGQVSAVRPADDDAVGEGRQQALPVARRHRRAAVAGPSRLGRIALTAALVGAATVGVLWYQQLRFERQIAADLVDRKRLEVERERLEREKADRESRIAELRNDLRLAKDEAERVRLEAEIERERAKVDPARGGMTPTPGGGGDSAAGCKPGQPGCADR